MTIDEQLSFLKKGAVDLIREEDLRSKLERSAKTGKPLRVKLGLDPTAPDIHVGHTVVIRKLKAFQDLGHTVIFLIGDFTGMIGDPSGRNVMRPPLSREEITANAETYQKQMFKLLDPEKTELRFNGEWMDKFTAADFVKLTAKTTVKQILERDDFDKRIKEEKPISNNHLHCRIVALPFASSCFGSPGPATLKKVKVRRDDIGDKVGEQTGSRYLPDVGMVQDPKVRCRVTE